jgi:HSP20 family protein
MSDGENGKKLDTKSADENSHYSEKEKANQCNIVPTQMVSPFSLLRNRRDSLLDDFNDLMNSFFDNHDHMLSDFANFNKPVGRWPKIDIEEDEDNYYVIIAAPGFKKDEIDIELKSGTSGHVLIVCAEKEIKTETKKHYSEIRYSKGTRCIPIAGSFKNNVDTSNIKAKENDNGTVSVVLPKVNNQKEKSNSKKINIE